MRSLWESALLVGEEAYKRRRWIRVGDGPFVPSLGRRVTLAYFMHEDTEDFGFIEMHASGDGWVFVMAAPQGEDYSACVQVVEDLVTAYWDEWPELHQSGRREDMRIASGFYLSSAHALQFMEDVTTKYEAGDEDGLGFE